MKLDTATDYRLGSNKVCLAVQNTDKAVFYAASDVVLTRVLSGNTNLQKYGNGILTLSATNTHTGGTTINGGTVSMPSSSAIGSTGNITFLGGTLQMLSGVSLDIGSRIKNSTSSIILDLSANQTWTTVIDSSNVKGLTKRGAGSLTLNGNNTLSGELRCENGRITLGNNHPNITNVVINAPITIIALELKGNVLSSSVPINIQNVTGIQTPASMYITVSSPTTFSNPINIDPSQGRAAIYTNGNSTVNIDSTITITGSGISECYIVNAQTSSLLTFNAYVSAPDFTNSFSFRGSVSGSNGVCTGALYIPKGSIAFSNINQWTIYKNNSTNYKNISFQGTGVVKLGETNAISTNALLIWSSSSSHSFDMNGFDQTVVGIFGASGSININNLLTNNGATSSVLTLSGLETNRSFYGTIQDGTSKVSLVMNSTGRVQTLSGANRWSGYTAISAGTLTIGTLVSGVSAKFSNAAFTPSTLTVTFISPPASAETYKILNGVTINTYPSVTLTNGGGKTATYNSTTSTLTIN